MATEECEVNIKNGRASNNNLKRNNYFKGKQLSAKDLTDEQDYLMDKLRRISLFTNGSGVIEGLRIASITQEGNTLNLTPGAAVDTQGNLLYLHQETPFKLARKIEENDYIYLQYIERGTDTGSSQNTEECDDKCCYNKIEEDFEVILDKNLLTTTPRNICNLDKRPLKEHEAALVLIGQYNQQGGTQYTKVNTLYKNSELSKHLCKISEEYVRSVNGKTGHIKTISSINNATPNDEGQLNLIAGNNISINSEGDSLTIATKSGYYKDYHITIAGKNGDANNDFPIKHNSNRFPSVDIYRRELGNTPSYSAVHEKEILQTARDTKSSYEEVIFNMSARSVDEHVKLIATSNSNPKAPVTKKNTEGEALLVLIAKKQEDTSSNPKASATQNNTVGEALFGEMQINSLSSSVLKLSDRQLSKVIDNIRIVPNYHYVKVVGTQDPNINITVTHLNRNQISLTNNNDTSVSLLVVLNT